MAREGRIEMRWKSYFTSTKGTGYLATADRAGKVDIAVYSRPHVLKDETLAFGMGNRLTHTNLAENPHAVYAFNEGHYQGVRLYLEKLREETSGPLLEEIRAAADEIVGPGTAGFVKFVVHFRVVKDLPLVGTR
jgi:hypothetical protein